MGLSLAMSEAHDSCWRKGRHLHKMSGVYENAKTQRPPCLGGRCSSISPLKFKSLLRLERRRYAGSPYVERVLLIACEGNVVALDDGA